MSRPRDGAGGLIARMATGMSTKSTEKPIRSGYSGVFVKFGGLGPSANLPDHCFCTIPYETAI
jgi:hypothetical protein